MTLSSTLHYLYPRVVCKRRCKIYFQYIVQPNFTPYQLHQSKYPSMNTCTLKQKLLYAFTKYDIEMVMWYINTYYPTALYYSFTTWHPRKLLYNLFVQICKTSEKNHYSSKILSSTLSPHHMTFCAIPKEIRGHPKSYGANFTALLVLVRVKSIHNCQVNIVGTWAIICNCVQRPISSHAQKVPTPTSMEGGSTQYFVELKYYLRGWNDMNKTMYK